MFTGGSGLRVNILGAGLAGLSAAITLSELNIKSNLISVQPSERAQSVMAEGGINGVLNTMGEDDKPENHMNDTLRAGVFLADPEAVKALTDEAPDILRWLHSKGVPFNMKGDTVIQRNFGGQKKKRTAFGKSSTGKILMTALIDETRKWEARGHVLRYPHHEFRKLILNENNECKGLLAYDTYNNKSMVFEGPVICCCGGFNGVFPGRTTGTTANSGQVQAILFDQGVEFSNLEMIQYHPTTFEIIGKRCLISEAARGEGGRLFVEKEGKPWYFMEEKYPEYGNLMPRDVVSRESYYVTHDPACGGQVYLDLTGLPEEKWQKAIPDLREELIDYMQIDPKKKPVPVEPGIHYFMGGISVDKNHRTNVKDLFAAGECACQYHGANRLGANSTLGAIFGGRVAARVLAEKLSEDASESVSEAGKNPTANIAYDPDNTDKNIKLCRHDESGDEDNKKNMDSESEFRDASPVFIEHVAKILFDSLGIVRVGSEMEAALSELNGLEKENSLNTAEKQRLNFAKAILMSALERRESRGAHTRSDFPDASEEYKRNIKAVYKKGRVIVE